MTRVCRVIMLATALTVMMTGAASAQATGSIFGKVTDASGGVLPGVTVTVSGPSLQQPLVGVSQESGAYQFPVVPIGTFSVTFELSGFKKVVRNNIVIVTGFNVPLDMKMEVGAMSEELTVSAAAPVVDTKKTTSGATFTSEILEKIPTARDPWQIINMTPGVQAGLNVGGSASGQQVSLASRGTGASVQWNLEGGSITDLAANSSPTYFNFDSFDQISVTNGGGDVSVQSSGLSINLVTKSGSNVFKGSAVGTFENDRMQNNNVTAEQFVKGTSGFLSGAPIKKIYNISGEYGGPLIKNRLWWWAAADKQAINAGVVNFFDRSRPECVVYADAQRTSSLNVTGTTGTVIPYSDLETVQDCLSNDQTILKHQQGKLNYQLNASHKFQYQFSTDNKRRNARNASAFTEKEATQQQTGDKYWGFARTPTMQLTHTFIATDRLVFNTSWTKVWGGFFLDYQDFEKCGSSRYTGSKEIASYPQAADPTCMFNVQPLTIRTSGNLSRSIGASYQTIRPGTDIKTDGTYFLTNVLGGDHSLKFGAGYRRNPITSFSHESGGGRAQVQCVGNSLNNCGDGKTFVAVNEAAAGLVPYNAALNRDSLLNNDWWSYDAYLQDSYSYKRLRVNAGLRYDWQQSKWKGGCVAANPLVPTMLPAQCDEETSSGVSPLTGQVEKIRPFSNWSPRVSLTYDLTGNGKTALKATGSYYYATKITLANALSGLPTTVGLTWGANTSSGACSTAAGATCWTDANHDGFVQTNELVGTPTGPANFINGVLQPGGNLVSNDAKLSRTRELTAGISHELISNLAVGADYIYRRYDRGTAIYVLGYEPGAAGFPATSVYNSTPLIHTDTATGKTAPYFTVQQGLTRPVGQEVTSTNLAFQSYQGVDLTLQKRYSDKWQFNVAVTLQKRNDYRPLGAYGTDNNGRIITNPTGIEFQDGRNVGARYLIKVNGSYDLPWGIMASTNFNMNDGAQRTLTINGPGQVYGGTSGTITYNTLNFEKGGTTRLEKQMLWDFGINKTFTFRGGQ
ncbi:MAG TPA: carboxypeptidase regulatory-like domain-containing protein, partial [Vicinamibacterales bacterium]|nr:carboxypeptidase regulatory-like domain-containing protein [Vicinamibacterales bacterium]